MPCGEYEIGELKTLLPFHEAILQTPQWANAETCRDLIEDRAWLKTLAFPKAEKPAEGEPRQGRAAVHRRGLRQALRGQGHRPALRRWPAGQRRSLQRPPAARTRAPARGPRQLEHASSNGHSGDTLTSPLQGTVFKVAVEKGAAVQEGALICVIEAMKMENEITAHKAGVVAELGAAVGAAVSIGDTLAVICSD